ncbi:MspA family porin [Aldersonia kunmingensis]|uniref:MspA family porin n=1 Tax=Aldersonia kunmingensis TaxID=408066 RepID=UPI00082E921C|nr:MspA family porin [Aldersonia kunmingensis]
MNSMLKNGVRLAGVGAVTAIALGFFSAGAANADTFVPLPDGQIIRTLDDGTVVTVKRVGESALISPSLGATPLHRNVWTSGTAIVETSIEADSSIEPGYIVGCQINFGGADFGLGGGIEGNTGTDGGGGGAAAAVDTTGDFHFGPGQAVNYPILDLESPDDYGDEGHDADNGFSGTSGSVNWSDMTFGVTGCAGYAQARSYVTAYVATDNVSSTVTLWGQPFSIG